MPLRSALLVAALCAAVPLRTEAQRHPDLVAGASVRVHVTGTPPLRLQGELLSIDSSALALERFRGDTLRVPFDEIERLELRTNRSMPAAFGRGALRGFVVGAIVSGGLIALGAYMDHKEPCGECFISATGIAAIVGVGVTGISTTLGGVIGLTRRGHWITVAQRPPDAR